MRRAIRQITRSNLFRIKLLSRYFALGILLLGICSGCPLFKVKGPSAPPPSRAEYVVVLDPGHDVKHTSALAADGTPERDLNWNLAIDVKVHLEATHGDLVDVLLTRNSRNFSSPFPRTADGLDNELRRRANFASERTSMLLYRYITIRSMILHQVDFEHKLMCGKPMIHSSTVIAVAFAMILHFG